MIRTRRLLLRQWRDDDLPAFAKLNADPRVREFFPYALTRPQSDNEAAWARKHLEVNGWGLWAVEVVGQIPFAGFVGLSPPDFNDPPFRHVKPCIEIGWRLSYDCWGCGYATEAAIAAAAFGFDNLGLQEIVSFTATGNLHSRRVMSKIGMTHDPNDDFYYPCVPPNHPLGPHVLYRLAKQRCST